MPQKVSDKIDIDRLAEILGLPDWSKIEDMNMAYFMDASAQARRDAIAEEYSEGEAEDIADTAHAEAEHEVWSKWYDGVTRAAEELFGEHELELKSASRRKQVRPYELRVVPKTTWNAAAEKLMETINGVGMFHFSSLKEFLDSGPYTARQAVLTHLPYIKRYPDVYGSTSAKSLYEIGWGR